MPNTLLISDTMSPSFRWRWASGHLPKAIWKFKCLNHPRAPLASLAQIRAPTFLPHSTECRNTCNLEKYQGAFCQGAARAYVPPLGTWSWEPRADSALGRVCPSMCWRQGPGAVADTAGTEPGLRSTQWIQSGAKGDGARKRNGDKAKDESMI